MWLLVSESLRNTSSVLPLNTWEPLKFVSVPIRSISDLIAVYSVSSAVRCCDEMVPVDA
jgi:hypothetical protein